MSDNLRYDVDQRIDSITVVLDEYTGWFMLVLRCLSYPKEADLRDKIGLPETYARWVQEAQQAGLAQAVVTKLNSLHSDLVQQATQLIEEALQAQTPPAYKDYHKLMTFYEEFINHIRRVEKDIMLEDNGIDPLTGLRSMKAFKKDYLAEMERLARQGKPFTVALMRIDGLESMKESYSTEQLHGYQRDIADVIKKGIRSFDDGYRMESDEYLLLFKQSDMQGGIKAMERLKRELERENLSYQIDDKTLPVSLSSCIAEPVIGDQFKDLLGNLRQDLDECDKDKGVVLEYFEMSPLERYLRHAQE